MQPQNLQIEPGAVVLARDGFIGKVEEVFSAPAVGQPGYFITAPNQNGDRLLIPLDLVDSNSAPGEVFLKEVFQEIILRSRNVPAGQDPRSFLSQMALSNNHPSGLTDGGIPDQSHLTVPIVEERLEVNKRTVEMGALEIRKTVEQVQDSRRLPLAFDELDVEHVAVNRMIDGPLEPRYEGEVYVIPVMEEVLVVEKRLMLKEEVRITRRQVTRDQSINETLRREHVEIVSPDSDLVNITDNSRQMASATLGDDKVDEIIDGDMDPSESEIPLTGQPTMPNTSLPYFPGDNGQPDSVSRNPSEEPA